MLWPLHSRRCSHEPRPLRHLELVIMSRDVPVLSPLSPIQIVHVDEEGHFSPVVANTAQSLQFQQDLDGLEPGQSAEFSYRVLPPLDYARVCISERIDLTGNSDALRRARLSLGRAYRAHRVNDQDESTSFAQDALFWVARHDASARSSALGRASAKRRGVLLAIESIIRDSPTLRQSMSKTWNEIPDDSDTPLAVGGYEVYRLPHHGDWAERKRHERLVQVSQADKSLEIGYATYERYFREARARIKRKDAQ